MFKIIADDLGLAIPVNDGILFLLKEKKIELILQRARNLR